MRAVDDKNILDEFCTRFCEIAEKHCKYIVVSGFVAISSGRVRGTEDIDMIIETLSLDKFEKFHNDLVNNDFVCMQSKYAKEIYTYLTSGLNVRYTYRNKPLPEMEVKFAKDELDIYQLETRQKIPLTGLEVWFSSINMNIAFKEELLKSDKDLKDAKHLRTVFREEVNEVEIDKIKQKIRRLRL